MRVYLTGFMASGKSTVGPRVAARLGTTFIDLDRLITAHEGRSIPTLFAEEGESYFRARETEALNQTIDRDDLVVALGGGALVDDENRARAQTHGQVVYLEVDPETILQRVADEADRRPLLQDDQGNPLPRTEMLSRIRQMLSDRRSSYEAAHATVDARPPVETVVQRVVEAVRAHD